MKVASNSIGSEGAKLLAEALKSNRVLSKLKLGMNLINDEGSKTLASCLENKPIELLNLSSFLY